MKYFLIAGEASGDLHASNLISSLSEKDPGAEYRFIGGDKMADAAGVEPLFHYKTMNYMGVSAVIRNLSRLRRILKATQHAIAAYQPDAVILVDYAGFNLRVARFTYRSAYQTFYYIPPKVWAWRKGRIRKLARYTHQRFVIFPFEKTYFDEKGLDTHYLGNPLMDEINAYREKAISRTEFLTQNGLAAGDKPILALLAGSRKQEIDLLLPEMVEAAGAFPQFQCVIAGAPSADPAWYEAHLKETDIAIAWDATYDLLNHAALALVTSGTATLETALFDVPQVVAYKTGKWTYAIGRHIVKITFFSLVNLIRGKEVVRELLQHNLAADMEKELRHILDDEQYRLSMKAEYTKIRASLGEPGSSGRVAEKMIALLFSMKS